MFSTQGLKYPPLPSFSQDPGQMFMIDLLHPKPTPVNLKIKGKLDLRSFNPHGISAYTDETGDVQILTAEKKVKLLSVYGVAAIIVITYEWE